MNPHRSLFYLTSAPLWKVLTILLCLAGVQLGGALWLLQEPDILVDTLLDHLLFRWSAAVALALVMAVLLYTTGGYNAGYTMARLRLKAKTQFRWFMLRGVLMFFLCWAVQLESCWVFVRFMLQGKRSFPPEISSCFWQATAAAISIGSCLWQMVCNGFTPLPFTH